MFRRTGVIAIVGAALVAAGCGGVAPGSKRRLAVLEFEGARGHQWRDRVAQVAMDGEFHVVSARRYSWTADKLGVQAHGARAVSKIGQHLDLAAVVEGRVIRRSRRRGTLRLTLRDGHTGKIVRRIAAPIRRGKLTELGEQRLRERLTATLADLSADDSETAVAKRSKRDSKQRTRARRAQQDRRSARRADRDRKRAQAQRERAERERERAERKRDRRAERKRDRRAERERDRRAERERDRERAERDRERAERDRERARRIARDSQRSRRVASEDTEAKEDPDRSRGRELKLETDSRGQVIDDELPAVLK